MIVWDLRPNYISNQYLTNMCLYCDNQLRPTCFSYNDIKYPIMEVSDIIDSYILVLERPIHDPLHILTNNVQIDKWLTFIRE